MLLETACPACGAANRIASGRDMRLGKCGACGASLALDQPVEVDDAGLARQLAATKGPLVVDVWAPWCGPCRMMAPNFAGAAEDLAGEVRFLKINADQSAEVGRWGVRGIPTLVVFENGREIARQAGLMPRGGIIAFVREAAAHKSAAGRESL